jgi:hypothetical protein
MASINRLLQRVRFKSCRLLSCSSTVPRASSQCFWNLFLRTWWDSLDGGGGHRKASTCTGQLNTERRGQPSMLWAGLKPTINTHVPHRATTVIGNKHAVTTEQKWNHKQVHPRVIKSLSLSHDTRVKVILVARTLLTPAAQSSRTERVFV